VVLGRDKICEGEASKEICCRVRNRVRSTTATERPSRLATKQNPWKRLAFGFEQPAAAREVSSNSRRDIGRQFTLLF